MLTRAERQRRLYAKRNAVVKKYRAERGCERCPETHPATLDLHHCDGAEKHPKLRDGSMMWKRLSFADIEAELAKCIVLCANCHRKHHHEEATAA